MAGKINMQTGSTLSSVGTGTAALRQTPVTIGANKQSPFILQEGDALTIKGAAATTGTVARLDATGATLQTWTVGTGTLPPIGPFAGTQQFQITCTAGSIDATVGDAVLSVIGRDVAGAPGVAKPSGGVTPFLITSKTKTMQGASGLGLNYQAGGQANRNVHMVRAVRAAFHGVEIILFANSAALTVYDSIAVAPSARLRDAVPLDQVTPSGAWTVGPANLTCANTGTVTQPTVVSTGFMACRSVDRDDGGKFPLLHTRVFTVAGLPGAASPTNFQAGWDAANPNWPMRCFDQGGGVNLTASNQGNFNQLNRNALIVPAIIKPYYDKAGGITGLGIGDSSMIASNVNDGSVAGMSYGYRAVRALQDIGLPFDFHNAGVGGNTWAQYAPRGKAMMVLMKPDFVLIPVGTGNEAYTTQADIDAQWLNCMDLVRYAIDLGILPILTPIWPAEYSTAPVDAGRRTLNQRAFDSGFNYLDIDASVGTKTTPVRWLPGLCDDLVGMGGGAGVHGNGLAMQKVADEQLAPLLKRIFF